MLMFWIASINIPFCWSSCRTWLATNFHGLSISSQFCEGWLPYFEVKKEEQRTCRNAIRTSKRYWYLYETGKGLGKPGKAGIGLKKLLSEWFESGYPEPPDMFEKLLELDKANYPMTTGPRTRKNLRSDGLVFPHAYSVLRVEKVNDFKLLSCNWGNVNHPQSNGF